MGIIILAGILIAMIWGKLSYDGWQKRRRRFGQRKGPRLGLGGRRREDGSYEPDYDSDDYDSGDDDDDGTLAAVTADMVADRLLRMADRYDNAGNAERAREAREAAEQARHQSASEAARLERAFSSESGGHSHGHGHSHSSSSDTGSSSDAGSSSSSYTDNS